MEMNEPVGAFRADGVIRTAERTAPERNLDWVLICEILLIIIAVFLKIYVNGLYIAETGKAATLRQKIKQYENENVKNRLELSHYTENERLKGASKTLGIEDEIHLVVVK